jgi:ribosome-associated protein
MEDDDVDTNIDTADSRRQIIKREQRVSGDRSAKVARALMAVPGSTLIKLELEEDLAEALQRARAIKSNIARRREERGVAAALRRINLPELEARLANIESNGVADLRLFQQAEKWRERLIADESGALAAFIGEFPNAQLGLEKFLVNAKRERETGKPPGGARALFRHIIASTKPKKPAP